ncbi:MAG: hypothetical protein G01um101430_729 [Parcubacteria group bacterium Gr01-1014_30]|nr:MAG: hypothetical protein G01um101430_729 [Parcubacteria group bacterium Gr01-1014_30]
MTQKAIIALFFVGVAVAFLLVLYGFSLVMFVSGASENQGLIAYVPKWIYPLALLVFFENRREVQDFLDRLADLIFHGRGK